VVRVMYDQCDRVTGPEETIKNNFASSIHGVDLKMRYK
jgi:hypothetical protein